MLPIHTILHPTDFSDHSDYAYRLACVIARECAARLIVLHVEGMHIDVPQPMHTEMGIAFDCSGDYHSHDADLKAQLREQFGSNPEIRAETRLMYGDAAEEILHVAEEVHCDLIVMGTHGRSGLGRLLMGSVAESVLSMAPCPVLTVKSPAKAQAAGSAARGLEAATA